MDKYVIEIKDIVKKYNLYSSFQDRFRESISLTRKVYHTDFYALNGINFNVKKGETVGIVGTNGSGKSTLLKIITGVLKPTAGSISVDGKISALLELGAGFNQEYTGLENIFLNGRMMGYTKKEMEKKVDSIIDFAEIGDFINQPVKTYSSGMFARLAFAVAINVEPDILIVDEALSVGDLFFQNKCFKKFDELKEKNVTILFVSHDISSVRQMCSRVVWIEKGKQIIFDSSDVVCDMYMDMKRQTMNKNVGREAASSETYIDADKVDKQVCFPTISWKNSAIESEKVKIISFFITDEVEKQVNYVEVNKRYIYHVVAELCDDIDELILGVVCENNKGIPIYDLNNYINSGKNVHGKKGQIVEVLFDVNLPRIMKGNYIISVAAAQGSQKNNVMLSWLHGVSQLEVINNGYNSSYIEIPAEVTCNIYEKDKIKMI